MPSWRTALAGKASSRVFARLWGSPLQVDRLRRFDYGRVPSRVPGCTVTQHEVAGTQCGVIIPRRVPPRGTTLYAHGGAYATGPTLLHWQFAGQLARAVGTTVVLPLYRLAPEDGFPAAFDDLTAIIDILSPDTLVGDSSGGGLVTALSLSLELTSSLVLHSPWLDLDMDRPEVDESVDPLFSAEGLGEAAGFYVGGADLADPRISPINGDLSALPRTLLFVGTNDIMANDCRRFRDLCESAGADLEYQEIVGSPSAATAMPGLPETKVALASTAQFITQARASR